MKKSEKAKRVLSKSESSNPVHNSSYTIRHDPDDVASVIKQYFSLRELHAIVRLLSASLPPQSRVRVDIVEGDTISRLYEGLRWSELRVSAVPQWTIHVIKSGVWEHRFEKLLGQIIEFKTFRAFIETPPPMGMGSSLEKLREICSGSEEALRLIDEVAGE
jgi:hypothetical protein